MIFEVWWEGTTYPNGTVRAQLLGTADALTFGEAAAEVNRQLVAAGKDFGAFDATALTIRGRRLYPSERAARAAFG